MEDQESPTAAAADPVRRPRELACDYSPGNGGGQAPWTAARCQRLLRPLSSKIALLRKLKRAEALKHNAGSTTVSDEQQVLSMRGASIGPKEPIRDCHRSFDGESAEWECNPRPSKRMRWTYSARFNGSIPSTEEVCTSERPSDLKDGPMDILSQLLNSSSETSRQTSSSSQHQLDDGRSYKEKLYTATKRASKSSRKTFECDVIRRVPGVKSMFPVYGKSKEACMLHKGITDSLMAMLISTRGSGQSEPSGCRSLFSMCLKRVPEYILEEEQCAMEEDPDSDLDISSMIYSDLEASAVAETWKPLRQIVRAHGVLLIEAAIQDDTIQIDAALSLVTMCLVRDAPDAAQSLLRSTIVRLSSNEYSSYQSKALFQDRMLVLQQLRNFTQWTGRSGFLYQQLKYMVQSTNPWNLGHQIQRSFLSSAIQAVALGRDDLSEALGFIRAIIRSTYVDTSCTMSSQIEKLRQNSKLKRKRTTLRSRCPPENTTRSLRDTGRSLQECSSYALQADETDSPVDIACFVAMMSALNNAQPYGPEEPACEISGSLPPLLDALAIEAYQFHELALMDRECQEAPLKRYNMSILFVEKYLRSFMALDDMSSKPGIVPSSINALSSLSLTDDDLKQLGIFVHNIARFHGMISGGNAFELIGNAVRVLTEAATSPINSGATQALLRKMAVTSAFAFSEGSGQPAQLDWALSVEQTLCPGAESSPRRAFTTPAKTGTRLKEGYRWEEGICEWIAKTPAIQLRQPSTPTSVGGESDESDDILANTTPMTSPISDTISKLDTSHSEESQRRPRSALPLPEDGHISFVRITTGRSNFDSRDELQTSQTNRRMTKETPLDSEPFQDHGTCDDIDELSTAQCAGSRDTRVSLPDRQQQSRKQCQVIKGNRDPHTKGLFAKTNASRFSGRRGIPMSMLKLAGGEDESSDAEDELSFS